MNVKANQPVGANPPAEPMPDQDPHDPLPQSDELLRALVDNLPNGLAFVLDRDLRYRLAGGAGLKPIGLTPADFVGKSLVEALGPELGWRYEPLYRQALDGLPFTLEHDFHGRSFRTHGGPLPDKAGVVYAVLAVSCDVTQHRLTEQAWRGDQERHAFLVRLGDALRPLADPLQMQAQACRLLGQQLAVDRVGFLDVDGAGQSARVHPAYQRGDSPAPAGPFRLADYGWMLPYLQGGEAIIVADAQDAALIPPAEREAVAAVGIRALITLPIGKAGTLAGAVWVTESRPRDWSESEIDLVRETAERLWATIERARAEEALRQQEERMRIAIEAAEMGIWEWNLGTDEVYWNKQHYRLFGLPPRPDAPDDGADLTAQPPMGSGEFLRHVHPDDLADVQARLARTIQDRVVYQAEFRTVRQDGTVRWMSGYGRVTGETGGQADRLSGVMYDIDDRKRAEDALRLTDRRKDEFLAMLAHELRNPLVPIANLLQVLQLTSGGDQTVGPAVDLMNRQVDHLVRLVDDLLDVSRISQGKIELRRQRLDLGELVEQATDALRPLYQATHRHLSLALPAQPVYVEADPTRLAQVVSNLLTNGARYTHAGGQVHLTLEPVNGEALLRVADNGIGLAPEQLEIIFELFVQVDTSLARSQGGLGLGLTLIKRLVELHGGRVEARSKGLNEGSEFLVRLPTLS